MLGPTLVGEGIRLEPPKREYAETYIRWFADPVVTRYLQVRNPPALAQQQDRFDRIAASDKDVSWTIVAQDSGKIIGSTGLHEIDWRHRHSRSGVVIGDRAEWGKGYAPEATKLRNTYAFTELGLETLVAHVVADNINAQRCFEKVGYRQCGVLHRHWFFEGTWHDLILLEVHRDEWKS